MARARVEFRRHLVLYLVMSAFFVVIWFVTIDDRGDVRSFWPIWPMLGWGIGIAFHAWGVYGGSGDAVAREEEKIRSKL